MKFILNNQTIETDLPKGMTLLDFVRYHKNLKGTKIGCREGDCGACTILIGELKDSDVEYRSMTSCLTPLANAEGKHIVTVEGINRENGDLTPVQKALLDESGTQCGFCTVGFVMSMTCFSIDKTDKTKEMAISAVDGNICRCTGYKSIERACGQLAVSSEQSAVSSEQLAVSSEQLAVSSEQLAVNSEQLAVSSEQLAVSGEQLAVSSEQSAVSGEQLAVSSEQLAVSGEQLAVSREQLESSIQKGIVPEYFSEIKIRLKEIDLNNPQSATRNPQLIVGGGTDLYVQKHDEMVEAEANHVFYDDELRQIKEVGEYIEIGASVTVTDLLESPIMQYIFPNLYKHLKLISSTPIRNMATLAGNFVNASPIGDMTVWFLAMDAEIELEGRNPHVSKGVKRTIKLKDFFLDYKKLAKSNEESIKTIRFKKPNRNFYFNFEKVCKRTYLDIATVNTAISLNVSSSTVRTGVKDNDIKALPKDQATDTILEAHVAAGGVSPIPLYLRETSEFLIGKEISKEAVSGAIEVLQKEISPISDVRGTKEYKRLLLRQLFTAHFFELFGLD